MEPLFLSHQDCWTGAMNMFTGVRPCPINYKVYGVPRGGIPVAYLLLAVYPSAFHLVQNPEEATLFVDDIIDSGRTKQRYAEKFPDVPFLALCDHIPQAHNRPKGQWVVFPWEQGDSNNTSGEDIVTRLLQYIGEDPQRGGLQETPQRVLKAWKEWTSGYGVDPASVMKYFEDGGEDYNEMVVVKDLPFYSHCEHHLAPFFGTATIAYIPDGKVVGLSKLGRLLEIFARRLQVQERMTTQIADAIFKTLKPRGVGVTVRARHLCMESRGLGRQGHQTITTALRGVFFEDPRARSEFLSMCGC